MKIGLPEGQPNNRKGKSNKNSKPKFARPINKKPQKPKKVDPENIRWRDNGDTISAKIGGKIIHINKKNFNIQLENGFVINCSNIEDAKSKAILLFNT